MDEAAAELQLAVMRALEEDNALVAELGGPRIHAGGTAAAGFPHIVVAATSVYDGTTGSEVADERLLTLHIWSKARGKKEVSEIMERARARLEGVELSLTRLDRAVTMVLEFAEALFDEDLGVHHGLLRFRAARGQGRA